MNRLRGAALGIWLVWVSYLIFFPNWQEAAEREKDYRKDLGVHFVLKPPMPVAVPCYFVGCITAPPSYFHVVIDRSGFYEALVSVTSLLIVALVVFRDGKNGSMPSIANPKLLVTAVSLVALALPLPGTPYFPLDSMVAYLPSAILHPDHDHISVLIGFPFFFVIYTAATYFVIRVALWAKRSLRPEP